MPSGRAVIARLERFAPRSLAVPGDPVGIQIGDADKPVHKILVTLDVRPEVVAEAVGLGADMIVAHHPAVFRPVANLNFADPQKAMYAECIKHDLLVYAAHTNLDMAVGGMNDWLAQAIGLEAVHPFIDDGELADMGRIGRLPQSISLAAFAAQLKTVFRLDGLRVIARDLTRPVQTVAVLGGDGGKCYLDAKAAGADVFVTGDVYYHTGHDMLAADMPVIDPGHHIESIMKPRVAALLNQWAQAADWSVEAVPSRCNTDPYTFL